MQFTVTITLTEEQVSLARQMIHDKTLNRWGLPMEDWLRSAAASGFGDLMRRRTAHLAAAAKTLCPSCGFAYSDTCRVCSGCTE